MRISLVLLFAFFLLGACHKNEPVQSLGEYDVSYEKWIDKKIYTYVRMPGADTIVHEFNFIPKKDTLSLIQFVYVNNFGDSERHYWVSNNQKKLTEEYYYEFPDDVKRMQRIKGEIIDFKEVKDGKRYTGLDAKISFTDAEGYQISFDEEDHFIKDTVVMWQGSQLKALKFDFKNVYARVFKYFPIGGEHSESKGVFYCAQGIGLVKMELDANGTHYVLNLISIEKGR